MQIDDFVSKLDTGRFGFKVAKFDAEENDLQELLKLLASNDVKLCITKVSLEKLQLLNLLEQNGFLIKDIQVTYKYDLNQPIPIISETKNNTLIREATREDSFEIEKLARVSFSNYGHYAADRQLPLEKVVEIYGDWARRSVEDKNVADKIFLAEINGEIAGFLSFKINNHGAYYYAAGGLGCVSEKFKNQSIFRFITIAGLEWGKQVNLSWEEHNVLITNYPVNHSFIKLGFKIYRSFATLHCWV